MTDFLRWTTADFDAMSWHDVHIRGWRLDGADEATGCADIVLDIDYLLEWHPACGDAFEFTVCPAELRFHEAFGLKLALDYGNAALGPFVIEAIAREAFAYPTCVESFHWRLHVVAPRGELAFDAPRFTQVQTGAARRQRGQAIVGPRGRPG